MKTPSDTSPASLPPQADHPKPNVRLSVPVVSTPREACEILTISRRKLADLLATGRLKSRRVGRRRITLRCDLEKFLGVSLS